MEETRARELLDAERERLRSITASIEDEDLDNADDPDALPELSALDQHPAEVATETEDRSREFGLLEQYERELADIEDALRRLDEGTYGRCEVCGKPIPDERLEADPTARYDIEHEREIERREHIGADRTPPA